ncbi:MAG: hypothetical protein ACLR76_04290 [Alistipes sp.]
MNVKIRSGSTIRSAIRSFSNSMPVVDRFDRQQHFAYRLQILALPRVPALEFGQKLIDVHGSKVLSRSQI